jgi:hypothetical protein
MPPIIIFTVGMGPEFVASALPLAEPPLDAGAPPPQAERLSATAPAAATAKILRFIIGVFLLSAQGILELLGLGGNVCEN